MANVEVISLSNVPEKWLKLMLHLQNSSPGAFQLIFPSAKEAKNASKSMWAVMKRNPTWFPLVLMQRDCSIYVIKTQYVRKVMIQ